MKNEDKINDINSNEVLISRINDKKIKIANPLSLDYLQRRADGGIDEQNCNYYIKRRQRLCSHRSASGSIYCTEHSKESLIESRELDLLHRKKIEELQANNNNNNKHKHIRNKRVSAPKRMANPYSLDLTPNIIKYNWNEIYHNNESYPIHIDVGCAKGKCLDKLAKRSHRKCWNHLGLEIRPDLVSNNDIQTNLYLLACNFAASTRDIFQSLPYPGSCRLISFQFPDPWRRKKFLKRLIVQPFLIRIMAEYLFEGAVVYCSSDCEDVALHMDKTLRESPYYSKINSISLLPSSVTKDTLIHEGNIDINDENEWWKFNPLGSPSEREIVCEVDWRRVYRFVYVRNNIIITDEDKELNLNDKTVVVKRQDVNDDDINDSEQEDNNDNEDENQKN
jgi:tRNA (guanine-N7-)-methyltransferase